MSTWLAHLTFLQLFLLFATTVKGAPCNGATKSVTVNADGGVLYSSDYPENYYNSETCQWLLTATTNSKMIQLETMDIDLEQGNGCVDYIAAYDGSNDQAPLLKKWCGTDKDFVHSTGQNLFLKFVSNARLTRKGFAIAYHEITPYNVTCKDGQVVPVSVGATPVLYNFQHPNQNVRKCLWRFEPEDSGQHLALTVVSSSGNFIECATGYFALHDGADTSDAEILHWCDQPNAPLTAFYPSGSALMVMERSSSVGKPFSFQLSLKVQTRSAQGTCTGNNLPVIQVHKYAAPIFVALPYITTAGRASCPVLFREIEDGSSFRVDLLAVDNKLASCSSSAVSVYRGQAVNPGKSIQSECWNDSRPVFLDALNAVTTVAPMAGKTSVIQVLATDFYCTGFTQTILAFRSASKEKRVPEVMTDYLGYKSYCLMRFSLKAEREDDHALVQLQASLDRSIATIKVYDGQNTSNPVLYTVNKTTLFSSNRVIGSGRYLLVELITSGLGYRDLNYFIMKYSAVPVTVLCNNSLDEYFHATSTPKNLSSVNYPDYFPVDFLCFYTITTEKKGEVVHLKVLDADFSDSCINNLKIFNGHNALSKSYQLGLVCGGNPNYPTKLESTGSTMKLLFQSIKDGYVRGGWRVQYYSAPPTPPEDTEDDEDNTASIVGGVLGAIIAVLFIIIIYLVVKGRRKGRASL